MRWAYDNLFGCQPVVVAIVSAWWGWLMVVVVSAVMSTYAVAPRTAVLARSVGYWSLARVLGVAIRHPEGFHLFTNPWKGVNPSVLIAMVILMPATAPAEQETRCLGRQQEVISNLINILISSSSMLSMIRAQRYRRCFICSKLSFVLVLIACSELLS